MAGNDFLKNPAGGSPASAAASNNFLTNPAGAGPTAGKPPNFVDGSRPQQTGANVDLSGESEIRQNGGLVPLADRPDAGAGSIGNSRKPFKGI